MRQAFCIAPVLVALASWAQAATIPLSIANHSFEDSASVGDGLGGTLGWTHSPAAPNGLGATMVTTNNPSLTPPGGAQDGNFFIWGREDENLPSPNPATLLQRIDISSFATFIDASQASVDFVAFGLGDGFDSAQMRITFFDDVAAGTAIGGPTSSNVAMAASVWTPMNINAVAVPVGTRSIEVTLLAQRPMGTANDGGFDNVSGTISGVVPEPSALIALASLLGMGLCAATVRRRRSVS